MFENLKTIVKGVFNSKDTPDEKATDRQVEVENIVEFKEEIVAMVKREFERRKKERLPFELQWRLNTNFLVGNQFCDINLAAENIYEMEKLYDWEQREAFNQIAPIIETRQAKLGKLRPALTVLPNTSDLADVNTAKVSKAILSSTGKKQKMKKKLNKATAWSEQTGSVYFKSVWDKYSGQMIGTLEGIDEIVYEGDILTTVVTCYEMYPDSTSNELDNCRSIIHAKAYPVEVIKDIWNREVSPEHIEVYSMGLNDVGNGGLGYNANVAAISSNVVQDSALVMEYWERPSKKYPKGRLIIVAGEELLYYNTLPYKVGEDNKLDFPFIEMYCIDRPGSFFKTSIIERLIPVQRAYNAVKNRKHEYLNRAAIGVLTYEEGTIDEDLLEEDGLAPGTMIPRRQGAEAPRFLEYHSLPSQFFEEEQKLENLFILISGVSELSRNSGVPSGASGVTLSILKEQDDTRISITAENVKNSYIEIGKQWLRLYKQFALTTRMDRLVGENNSVQIIEWCKNDITSDDVSVEAEDELMQTPAEKKKLVYDIIQLGLMNDPDTGRMNKRMRSKVLEIMGLGNVESIDDIEQLQINKAQKENNLIKNGEGVEVKIFDDDAVHIFEHDRFRLSSDFETLEQERPDLAEYLNHHVLLHEQAIMLKTQQQQARMMAMQPQIPLGGNQKPPQ